MNLPRQTTFLVSVGLFVVLIGTLSSSSCSRNDTSSAGEEDQTWDATVVFLAGVFTVANAEDLDTAKLRENFRANYDWLKDVFLPHLRHAPEHDWQICDEFCIEAARRLAKGDPEKEKLLRQELSKYEQAHEH